jgi:DNA-binding protein HU-beta
VIWRRILECLAVDGLTRCGAGDYGGERSTDLEGSIGMNKGGLVAEVSKRTGLSKADVGRVVDASIDTIRETVVKGERVTLADFGTFERKRRNQRIARNPRKPDVPIVVPARDLPAFTPGKEFREHVLAKGRRRRS